MLRKNRCSVATTLILIALVVGGCRAAPSAPALETLAPSAVAPSPQPTNTRAPKVAPATPSPATPATASTVEAPAEAAQVRRIQMGNISSQALQGNLIGDPTERRYTVYLPPGYQTGDSRYPVLYMLHPFGGNLFSEVGLWRPVLDRLIASGDAGEIIVVFPDGSNAFGGSFWQSSATIGDYESYVARELVAHIDGEYRTIAGRNSRAITGHSMGGTGAIHLALKYPEVFGIVASSAGMYDLDDEKMKERGLKGYQFQPSDVGDLPLLDVNTWIYVALAAGAVSNADKPPLYLDMPFEIDGDGQTQIVPEVWERVIALDAMHQLDNYLKQSVRLNAIIICHGSPDTVAPVEGARAFDQKLRDLGVEHVYVEHTREHTHVPVAELLQFMSDHLEFGES